MNMNLSRAIYFSKSQSIINIDILVYKQTKDNQQCNINNYIFSDFFFFSVRSLWKNELVVSLDGFYGIICTRKAVYCHNNYICIWLYSRLILVLILFFKYSLFVFSWHMICSHRFLVSRTFISLVMFLCLFSDFYLTVRRGGKICPNNNLEKKNDWKGMKNW